MAKKTLQVTEIQTLPDGSIQLVLKNGNAVRVLRGADATYSVAVHSAWPSTGEQAGRIHTLRAEEVPSVERNIAF